MKRNTKASVTGVNRPAELCSTGETHPHRRGSILKTDASRAADRRRPRRPATFPATHGNRNQSRGGHEASSGSLGSRCRQEQAAPNSAEAGEARQETPRQALGAARRWRRLELISNLVNRAHLRQRGGGKVSTIRRRRRNQIICRSKKSRLPHDAAPDPPITTSGTLPGVICR